MARILGTHNCRLVILVLTIAALGLSCAADLKSDFREFSALVSRRRIGYIAARHYVLDQRFRHAFDYIRGPHFQDTWRRIRETTEFQSLVDYLTQNMTESDVTRLVAVVPQQLRSLELPSKVPVELLVQQRNLGNFLKDAVRSLPRTRIANLMVKKVQEGGDFAKLYLAASSGEFRVLLEEVKQSKNLAAPLEEIRKNSINVDEVMEIGFKVLKWGP